MQKNTTLRDPQTVSQSTEHDCPVAACYKCDPNTVTGFQGSVDQYPLNRMTL